MTAEPPIGPIEPINLVIIPLFEGDLTIGFGTPMRAIIRSVLAKLEGRDNNPVTEEEKTIYQRYLEGLLITPPTDHVVKALATVANVDVSDPRPLQRLREISRDITTLVEVRRTTIRLISILEHPELHSKGNTNELQSNILENLDLIESINGLIS